MKVTGVFFLFTLLNLLFNSFTSNAQLYTIGDNENNQPLDIENNPPIAINDTFFLFTGCGRDSISGDILANDFDPDGDEITLFFVVTPVVGELLMNNDGKFSFSAPKGYLGTLKFEYYISEVGKNNYKATAEVFIFVKADYDCDNVSDEDDIDNDNDGILNIHEGNGKIDSDADGVPDSFDIDSDNDGITDNEEWQREGFYVHPTEKDINFNGWDDAYDNSPSIGGNYYEAVDTDKDGIPDFLDTDSNNNGISDYIEGCDSNHDSIPEIIFLNSDSDHDGLDDAFDIISCWTDNFNSAGSNSPLPDFNKNGIRDWRDSDNSIPGEENYSIADQILLYPNPAKKEFTVNLPISLSGQAAKLLMFSAGGNFIFQKTITSVQNTVNIENYNPGVYIIKLQFDVLIHYEQLVISH